MSDTKLIQISVRSANEIVRALDRAEAKMCIDCEGNSHKESCPAKQFQQLRNYLTQRLNNPNKKYGI